MPPNSVRVSVMEPKINTGQGGSVNTSEKSNTSTSDAKPQKTPTRVNKEKHGWVEFGGEKQYLRIDAHHARWSFDLDGHPQLAPDKKSKMRGWEKKYWWFEGHTFVANPKTLEIWTEATGKKSKEPWTYKMLSEAWGKMDLARRKWSEWQRVGLKPKKTDHPLDLQSTHLVIKEKKTPQEFRGETVMGGKDYFKHLKAHMDRPDSAQIGLTTDKSDAGEVELNGPMSTEGGIGADEVFLRQPHIIRRIDKTLIFQTDEHARQYAELKAELDAIQARQEASVAGQAQLMRAVRLILKQKKN